MKIYYAHHLYKYNTKIEEYELNLIKREFPQYEILNPNGDIKHEDLNDEEGIMQMCLDTIAQEDIKALVFSSLSGVIGKGVYDEIAQARTLEKPIYYIQNNRVYIFRLEPKVINENRRIYAIIER